MPYTYHINNEFGIRNDFPQASQPFNDEYLYARDCCLPVDNSRHLWHQNTNYDHLQWYPNNWYESDARNWMPKDIPTPKDYASSMMTNNSSQLQDPYVIDYMDNYNPRPYSLWPTSTDNYLQNHFSPRQLQNILFSRDSRKANDDAIKPNRNNSLHYGTSNNPNVSEYSIPAKKQCLGDYCLQHGPHTPDQPPLTSAEKTFNCVRQLFPTNREKRHTEENSDNESDLCKKLSQTDDSHSTCSDQLSLVF